MFQVRVGVVAKERRLTSHLTCQLTTPHPHFIFSGRDPFLFYFFVRPRIVLSPTLGRGPATRLRFLCLSNEFPNVRRSWAGRPRHEWVIGTAARGPSWTSRDPPSIHIKRRVPVDTSWQGNGVRDSCKLQPTTKDDWIKTSAPSSVLFVSRSNEALTDCPHRRVSLCVLL